MDFGKSGNKRHKYLSSFWTGLKMLEFTFNPSLKIEQCNYSFTLLNSFNYLLRSLNCNSIPPTYIHCTGFQALLLVSYFHGISAVFPPHCSIWHLCAFSVLFPAHVLIKCFRDISMVFSALILMPCLHDFSVLFPRVGSEEHFIRVTTKWIINREIIFDIIVWKFINIYHKIFLEPNRAIVLILWHLWQFEFVLLNSSFASKTEERER